MIKHASRLVKKTKSSLLVSLFLLNVEEREQQHEGVKTQPLVQGEEVNGTNYGRNVLAYLMTVCIPFTCDLLGRMWTESGSLSPLG